VLGLSDRGRLAPGMVADIVVTDRALALRRVLRAGRWLEPVP
jgi:N-acetylglucosamine-6-phosphate deacetylase